MKGIKISITSYISGHQPGFVSCTFYDAPGREHIVHEKVPVVTLAHLDANSHYPQDGVIGCVIANERTDTTGRKIFTVNTTQPWHIDTIEGLSEFDVFEEQLTDLPGDD